MCGRYNVSDRPETQQLLTALRVEGRAVPRRNIAPGAHGQFVIERDGQRELLDGLWSLLIEAKPDGSGFRPSPKFSTFNARSDRLQGSPLWRGRYAHKRAHVFLRGRHRRASSAATTIRRGC